MKSYRNYVKKAIRRINCEYDGRNRLMMLEILCYELARRLDGVKHNPNLLDHVEPLKNE